MQEAIAAWVRSVSKTATPSGVKLDEPIVVDLPRRSFLQKTKSFFAKLAFACVLSVMGAIFPFFVLFGKLSQQLALWRAGVHYIIRECECGGVSVDLLDSQKWCFGYLHLGYEDGDDGEEDELDPEVDEVGHGGCDRPVPTEIEA